MIPELPPRDYWSAPIDERWCRLFPDPNMSGVNIWIPMLGDPDVIKDKDAEIAEQERQIRQLEKELKWWKDACSHKMHLIGELAEALADVDGWEDRDDQPLIDRAKVAATQASPQSYKL